MKVLCTLSHICLASAFALLIVSAQSTDYDKLITQAKAELSAGQMDQALADSQKAIALQANRWDAHMIAGYVLQRQKRYDEAIDEFTSALGYAPADKRADAKKFLEQCVREKVSRATTIPPANGPARPTANANPVPTATLESTMAFIQDKLNGQPPAEYAVTTGGRTLITGAFTASTYQKWVVSEGKADPQTCEVSWKLAWFWPEFDLKKGNEAEYWITMNLKDLQDVGVQVPAALGTHPLTPGDTTTTATVTAIPYSVHISTASNAINVRAQGHDRKGKPLPAKQIPSSGSYNEEAIQFHDENLANRMAAAIRYASGLCQRHASSPLPGGSSGASARANLPNANAVSMARGKTLMERAQQAMGGADKLAGLKDMTRTVDWTVAPGSHIFSGIDFLEGRVRRTTLAILVGDAKRFREEQEIAGGNKLVVYQDGKNGWVFASFATQRFQPGLPPDYHDMPFLDLPGLMLSTRDASRKVNAVGENTVRISGAGLSVTVEFDPSTALPSELIYQNERLGSEIMSDWRNAGGVMMPFKVEAKQEGRTGQATVVSYQFNTGLKAEDLSKRP
jgi:hypothetical protein